MRYIRGLYGLGATSFLIVAFAMVGCDRAPDNIVHVTGTVTFEGKPLPLGLIIFEPNPAKGGRGPQGHAEIKDGRFDTKVSKKGAAIGPQVVRITGGDGVNPEPFTPFGKSLFEEHTFHVDLVKDQTPLQLDIPSRKAKE